MVLSDYLSSSKSIKFRLEPISEKQIRTRTERRLLLVDQLNDDSSTSRKDLRNGML